MPNLTTTTGMSLTTLAQRINAEHEAAERAINESLDHARTCGELLNEAKATISHGGWQEWVEANFAGSYRTAAAYMRIAREWGVLADVQRSATLSIDGALKLLATPRRAGPAPDPLPPSARGWDDGGPIDAAAARSVALSDRLTNALQVAGIRFPARGRALVGTDRRSSKVVVITNPGRGDTWEGDGPFVIKVLQTFGEAMISQHNPNPIPWWLIVDWVHHHTGAFPWGGATWYEVDAPWPPEEERSADDGEA